MATGLVRAGALLKILPVLGTVALLVFFGRSSGAEVLPPFTPTFVVTVDEVAPGDPSILPVDDDCPVGSPCKHMLRWRIPDGQPGRASFPGVDARAVLPPALSSVAGDIPVPDGAIVGRIFGSERLGPVSNCNTGSVFPFDSFIFDATTDPATTRGWPSDLWSFSNWPTQLDGVRDDVLNDDLGAALHARWVWEALGMPTNVLVFELSDGALSCVAIDGDPAYPPGNQDCGPEDISVVLLGVSTDNPDTGPDEGGTPLFACTAAGTHTFHLFLDRNDTPPGDELDLFDTATCSPNTPAGSDVSVPLLGGTESLGGVEVVFSEVTTEGSTSVTTSTGGQPPLTGFKIVGIAGQPMYYDINTDATFSGVVEVCIRYDDSELTPEQENDLTLNRRNPVPPGPAWSDLQNITRDTTNNIICGDTDTLSIFTIQLPVSVGGIVEIQVDGSGSAVDSAAGSSGGSSVGYHIALAGAVAAGAIAVTAGAWYARRRWLG